MAIVTINFIGVIDLKKVFFALLMIALLGAVPAFAQTSFTVGGALTDFNLDNTAEQPAVPVGTFEVAFETSSFNALLVSVATDLDTVDLLLGSRFYVAEDVDTGARSFVALRAGGQFDAVAVPSVWLGTLTYGAVTDLGDGFVGNLEVGASFATDLDVVTLSPVLALGVGYSF